jgi:hypothetical protein
MSETNLSNLEYNILRFTHDNPDGIIQEDFTARLATERYIFGTRELEYNNAMDKLTRYGCIVNNWHPPVRKITITPRGEEVYEIEKLKREDINQITTVKTTLDKKTLEKTELDLKYGQWLWQTKWWPLFISLGSFLTAIISVCYAVRAYNLSVLTYEQQQIQKEQSVSKQEMQMQLQETKHGAYRYLDSLWKINSKIDSSERKSR